jgi:oxygen-independent coproporphyrinogen-3 oxidase
VTVECNPDDLDVERLAGYRRAGVTRISLGVQSLDDTVLPRLDRRHSAGQARRAFEAARTAGFDNVSIDLIYGLPGLDLATWTATVREALAWGPDHLSAYGLTLDEGSRWHAAGVGSLPAEETVTEQYWTLARLAADAGFEHYEISNYARPGFRSRHNQRYWRWDEYLALGPGACGFLGQVRYANVKPVERYWPSGSSWGCAPATGSRPSAWWSGARWSGTVCPRSSTRGGSAGSSSSATARPGSPKRASCCPTPCSPTCSRGKIAPP